MIMRTVPRNDGRRGWAQIVVAINEDAHSAQRGLEGLHHSSIIGGDHGRSSRCWPEYMKPRITGFDFFEVFFCMCVGAQDNKVGAFVCLSVCVCPCMCVCVCVCVYACVYTFLCLIPVALLPLSNGQTAALSIGKLEIAATRRDKTRRRDYHHGDVEHCDDSAVHCVYHEAVCDGDGNGVRNTCHTSSSSCAEGTSPSSHSAEENGVCRSMPSLGDSPCQRHSNAQPITGRRHTSSHRNHENGYDDVIGPCGDDGDVSADCNGERGSCRQISLCDGVGTCTGTCHCSGDAMTRRDHCEQCHNATDAVQNGELPRHSRAVQFNHITPTNQHQTGDSHHAAASSPCARTRCAEREGQTCPSTSLTCNHSRAQRLAMPMANAYLHDCGETCVDRANDPAAWQCTRSLIIETATKHAAESGSDTGMLVICVTSVSPVVFVGTSDWRW